MNNIEKHRSGLVAACVDALARETDARVNVERGDAGMPQTSPGAIELRGSWGSGRWRVFVKEDVRSLGAAGVMFAHLQHETATDGLPALVMAPHINPELARRLRGVGVQFVDASGNMWMHDKGLYVWVEGRRPESRHARAPRPFLSAGLRLVTLLLEEPSSVRWTYRAMAAASGVSLGAVSGLLDDLRRLGFLRVDRAGERRLVRARELFEQWERGYLDVLRPRLLRATCRTTGTRTLDDLAAAVERAGGVRLGGELAASRMTKHLRAQRATLFMKNATREATLVKLRLARDAHGAVDVLEAPIPYEASADAHGVVSPWLVHAELVRDIADSRIHELAALF